MENIKKEPSSTNAGIFSQDSAFLQQFQAGALKKNSKPTQQISLLTGKIGSSFPASAASAGAEKVHYVSVVFFLTYESAESF